MLTHEEIKKALDKDSNWTPPDNAPEADWDLFEEVYEEVYGGEADLEEDPWDDLEEVDEDVDAGTGKLHEDEEW